MEQVNHPTHYNGYDVEVIDMMERIWGAEETAIFCKLNAFKYRMRIGLKPDNPMDQDIAKEKWYIDKYNELMKRIGTLVAIDLNEFEEKIAQMESEKLFSK